MTTKARVAGVILGTVLAGVGVVGQELLGEPMQRMLAAGMAGGGMGIAAYWVASSSAGAGMTKKGKIAGIVLGATLLMAGAIGREEFPTPMGRVVARSVIVCGTGVMFVFFFRMKRSSRI